MKTKLIIVKDAADSNYYSALYCDNKGNELDANNFAYKGSLSDAIEEALLIFGLFEDDLYIEASN